MNARLAQLGPEALAAVETAEEWVADIPAGRRAVDLLTYQLVVERSRERARVAELEHRLAKCEQRLAECREARAVLADVIRSESSS